MDIFLEILSDALTDTVKLIPFLFVTYLLMEYIEHKASDKAERAIGNARYTGPLLGAFIGAFPQCGFSAAAATLYAGRVITLGTLIAVFLSTSDEMLPILIAEQADPMVILKILGFKVLVGMVMGFVIDAVLHVIHKHMDTSVHIHELCEQEHCHCDDGILKSATRHTLQVTLFIFLITFALNGAIVLVGEDAFAAFIASRPRLSILASALVGLIPNCAASVIITQLYLEGTLNAGAMMAGLLVSAGIGLLVLFRTNRPQRKNFIIVLILLITGVAWGLIVQSLGIVF